MNALLNRITINPDICHGKPTIRNKRYPVELILDLLSAGSTHREILDDYPSLENDDILACLTYAANFQKSKASKKYWYEVFGSRFLRQLYSTPISKAFTAHFHR